MSKIDDLKAEMKDLKSKYSLRSTSDSDKQIFNDRIKEIVKEIRALDTDIEQKVVPVLGGDVIADASTERKSSFIGSSHVRI